MKVQITTCKGSILTGKSYLHGKWLAERARTTILQQQLPSFREMLDQVHFSCRRLSWKVTKYDVHILWLTMSGYKLFERPSYHTPTETREPTVQWIHEDRTQPTDQSQHPLNAKPSLKTRSVSSGWHAASSSHAEIITRACLVFFLFSFVTQWTGTTCIYHTAPCVLLVYIHKLNVINWSIYPFLSLQLKQLFLEH